MPVPAPNKLFQLLATGLAKELRDRRVVLIFDPAAELRPFLDEVATEAPEPGGFGTIELGDMAVHWALAGPSLFQLRLALEPFVAAERPEPLLIYLPQHEQPGAEAVLMELIRAGAVFKPQLANRSRRALQAVMEPAKVREFLARPGLTYREIAQALEQSAGGGFSQLKGLFQQPRGALPENSDVVRLWLVSDQCDAAIATKGLEAELAELLKSRWGLALPPAESLAQWRHRCQRSLLLHEFLTDWRGDELSAFKAQPLPLGKEPIAQSLEDVRGLRRDHPGPYAAIAAAIEAELQVQERIAKERPGVLGAIDTFPCEERFLLRSVDQFLADRQYAKAQQLILERQQSFWLRGAQADERQIKRRAQWAVAEWAARLGIALENAATHPLSAQSGAQEWAKDYVDRGQEVDRLQRKLEQQVGELAPDDCEIPQGLAQLRQRYDKQLEAQTSRFTAALAGAGWSVPGLLPQQQIWAERVQKGRGRVAVFWVDALRFEMGVTLERRFLALQNEGISDLRLEPAQAALPTITPVGMAALLPGAERSFAVAAKGGKPTSIVDDGPVGWSDKAKRLAHLQQRVPKVTVLSLFEAMKAKPSTLAEKLDHAAPLVITSQGIDEAGEKDGENLANARGDMQRELDTIQAVVRKLASLSLAHPIERFVITADHGYLHGEPKPMEMRITSPAGKEFDLHRRCWVGHPATTPDPCVAIPPEALGYGVDGLTTVVPRSTGVLKAGGSLCFHHGGASLQELLIPVLSFRCAPVASSANGLDDLAWEFPERITNRILMVTVELASGLLNQGASKDVLLGAYDVNTGGLVATPIQALQAEFDRDTNRITLTAGVRASVGLMLPAEVSARKLRLELRDANTDVVLLESKAIAVDLIA